jgi:ADP-dependent glucokinase
MKIDKNIACTRFTLLNIAILIVIFAIIYNNIQEYVRKMVPTGDHRQDLLNACKIDLIVHSMPQVQNVSSYRPTVAIGYNSNVDLVVKAIPLLKQLDENIGMEKEENLNCDLLYSRNQLIKCFIKYFKNGNGVERFVANESLFNEMVSIAKHEKSHEFHVGGNAALMAVKFAKENWNVFLTGGAIGTTLRELLSPYDIQFITASNDGKTNEKNLDNLGDEIHMIMEYDRNEQFKNYIAPRANRFIATRDLSNAGFYSLDNFHRFLDQNISRIDLLVISGLHLLDSLTDVKERAILWKKISDRTSKTNTLAKSKKSHFLMHLELASIGQEIIYNEISEYLFPFINSIGLNEQELNSLYHAVSKTDAKSLTNIAQVTPNIKNVTEALVYLLDKFNHIYRIHFHSLAYHLVAVRKAEDIAAYRAVVASSSLTACTQACGFQNPDSIDLNKVDLLFKWSEQQTQISEKPELFSLVTYHGKHPDSIISWKTSQGFEMSLAPVLVCKQTIKTVGLGDAISTAGLSAEIKIRQAILPK